jgi:hypothetical protein
MESWNWVGNWWTPTATATWATNTSVSPTESAVVYGVGTGTSGVEQDWYSLPNITGLTASRVYQLRFKLASRTFTNSTATTKGVDVADYIDVQVSRNGGVTYLTELRIRGNNNSTWPYTSTGVINHTANGTFTNSAAPTGDVYTAPVGNTTTGPSTITLTMPTGITQIAVDLYCRINSAGEEWWIDNIELWDLTPLGLPVELTEFYGVAYPRWNMLMWTTASEHNSAYFAIERSIDGISWKEVGQQPAATNSNHTLKYNYLDMLEDHTINYYRLVQYDMDGAYKIYDPIALDNRVDTKIVVKCINLLGQEVDPFTAQGILLEVYEDGTTNKIIR